MQASLDREDADESLLLLREIGIVRQRVEATRGGISLDLPAQEVVGGSGGRFELRYEAPLPVEEWNAQISLLAGTEAARLMIEAGVGVVRTLPPPEPWQLDRLRRTAGALHVPWPRGARWADVVRGLDRDAPADAAFLIQAAHLLRGAGYTKLDPSIATDPTTVPVHAGVGAPYAHVTAPLRRLVDRYANEVVVAHCAGQGPPEWVGARLDDLVIAMRTATERAARVERAVVDAAECAVLGAHVGERFDGVVVDRNGRGVVIQLHGAAVTAPMDGRLALGQAVVVTLVAVDPVARRLTFAPATS